MAIGTVNLMLKKRLLKKTIIVSDPLRFTDVRTYANLRDILATCKYDPIRKDPVHFAEKIFDSCFNRINILLANGSRIFKDDLYEKILLTVLSTELMEHEWKSKYPRGKRYIRLSNVLNTSPEQRVRERKQEILDNIAATIIEGCLRNKVLKKSGNYYRKEHSETLPKYVNENLV